MRPAQIKNTFDVGGLVETSFDPSGNKTTVTFDARGNVLQSVDPLGATVKFQYDANDNVTLATDPAGHRLPPLTMPSATSRR